MAVVEVIIPWRGGCPHRERALDWVLDQWHRIGWPVTVAELAAGPWIKAKAVTPAVETSTADVIAVADADVWCDGISKAIGAVEQGAAWAIPHTYVRRLDEPSTVNVYAGGDFDSATLAERPYRGHDGGGLVALRRDTYLDMPLDPRFDGWGQEDDAWGHALRVTHGKPWRGTTPLIHLWHPPAARMFRAVGSHAGLALFRRYWNCRTPAAVRALVDEFKGVNV